MLTAPVSDALLEKLATALDACTGKCALALLSRESAEQTDDERAGFESAAASLARPEDHYIGVEQGQAVLVLDELIDLNHARLAGIKIERTLAATGGLHAGIVFAGRQPALSGSVERLLAAAESAQREARQSGVAYHVVTLDDSSTVENHWLTSLKLKEAMTAHHIGLDYQPKVRLDCGSLAGGTALVRWRDQGLIVPPGDFLPALDADTMWALTVYCVRRMLRDMLDHQIEVPLALHFDPGALTHAELPDFLTRETNLWGVPPELLLIEFGRPRDSLNLASIACRLEALKSAGFGLSVDNWADFWDGPVQITPDEFKLDAGPGEHPDAPARPTGDLIQQARARGVTTLADRVEDADTLETLRAQGCDLGQGFYLGAPIQIEQFRAIST